MRRHREKLGKKSRKVAVADAASAVPLDDDTGLELAGTTLADIDALLAQLEQIGTLQGEKTAESEGSAAPAPTDWIIASDEWELVGVVQADQRVSSFAFLPPQSKGGAARGASALSTPLLLAVALHSNVVEVHSLMPLSSDAPPPPGVRAVTTAAGITVAQSSIVRTIGGQLGHRADVRAVAVSADSSLLLSVAGPQARVWNAKSGACIRTLELGDATAVGLCAAFAPGSRHALVGTKSGRLLLFDLASTDLLESHDAHSAALWSIAIRPDARGCATGGADKEVRFWDFDLKAVAAVVPPATASSAKKAAPAAIEGVAKQLTLVHARTLKLTDEVLSVRYSHHTDPAQLLFAAALLDATVRVFFDDTLKFFLSLYGHKLPVLSMDISADSTLLVTASADKNVKVCKQGAPRGLCSALAKCTLSLDVLRRSGALTLVTATSRSSPTATLSWPLRSSRARTTSSPRGRTARSSTGTLTALSTSLLWKDTRAKCGGLRRPPMEPSSCLQVMTARCGCGLARMNK